jgi:hypothetical protein
VSEEIPGMARAREVVMAEDGVAVNGNGHSAQQVDRILRTLAVFGAICLIGIVSIGLFSIYLRTLNPPQEAGGSVGAIRENLMFVIGTIVGAFTTMLTTKATTPPKP